MKIVTRPGNTGLLVSVRNAEEAATAFAANVDIVDIKEPNNGSLGKASTKTIASILKIAPAEACISIALGELRELNQTSLDETMGLLYEYQQIRFAKLGLAGMNKHSGWSDEFSDAVAQLPTHVDAVAVAYADYCLAHSPHPRDVIQAAARLACGAVLLDTFSKFQGNIFAHLDAHQLNRFRNSLRDFGMRFVLAGSISHASLATAIELEPSWIGVRGAVCRSGVRENEICPMSIAQLQKRLNQMMKIRFSN